MWQCGLACGGGGAATASRHLGEYELRWPPMLFTTGGMHVEQLLIHKSMLMWAGHLMVSHTFVGKTHHDFQKGIGSI